jgi:hypothetical protein
MQGRSRSAHSRAEFPESLIVSPEFPTTNEFTMNDGGLVGCGAGRGQVFVQPRHPFDGLDSEEHLLCPRDLQTRP